MKQRGGAGGGGSSDKGLPVREGGMSQVKGSRRHDHFQALIAAHQIERLRAAVAREKSNAERLQEFLQMQEICR